MKEPVWMDSVDALAIHEKMLALHGGMSGIRDEGLLQSALGKPLNLFAYSKPTMPELAASYAAGVILNHPFFDGNKRAGFMIAAAFLEINGWRFVASEADAAVRTLALAAGEMSEAEFAIWLTKNSLRV
jgi:death-on-curing protein